MHTLTTLTTALVLSVFAHGALLAQAPTIAPGTRLFIEKSDFGMALAAALLDKKVPVTVVTDPATAAFLITTTSSATKEGQGERVAKVLALGVFAGGGKSFEATVSLATPSGEVVFANNVKKGSMKSAAEHVANKLKDHIAAGEKAAKDAAKKKR